MGNKINIAQLLKDCPKGMELYSPIFGTVYFEGIRDTGRAILIDVTTSCNTSVQFYSDGKFNTYYSESEVTLFPSKGQRDWSKFQKPFKDGDVFHIKSGKYYLCIRNLFGDFGDIIFHKDDIYYSSEDGYLIPSNSNIPYKVEYCVDEYFRTHETKSLEKMVKDKFDINTLIPFESKVLIRNDKELHWIPAFWGCKCNDDEYVTTYGWSLYCIPYEGNEHLCGTTDDCDDYYKTWE